MDDFEDKFEDMVKRAEIFATERHAGQMRKDNATPYIVHPAEMVASLKQCGIDHSYILAAAWLHDTVEDTNTTLDEIYDEFGPSVCGLVDVLTRRKPKQGHDIYNSRILSSNSAAKIIKVADLEHNMRTLEHLDKEAQERKLREAKELYLPLREDLCTLYECAPLFNALEEHVREYEKKGGETAMENHDELIHVFYFNRWKGVDMPGVARCFERLTEEEILVLKPGDAIWKDMEPYHLHGKVYGYTRTTILSEEEKPHGKWLNHEYGGFLVKPEWAYHQRIFRLVDSEGLEALIKEYGSLITKIY